MYIVELEQNVWIAPVFGYHGRTTIIECADKFATKKDAEKSLKEARVFRPFMNAKKIHIKNK